MTMQCLYEPLSLLIQIQENCTDMYQLTFPPLVLLSRRTCIIKKSLNAATVKSEVFERSLLQNQAFTYFLLLSIPSRQVTKSKSWLQVRRNDTVWPCFYHFHLAIFFFKISTLSCEIFQFLITELKAFYWKGPYYVTEVVHTDFYL